MKQKKSAEELRRLEAELRKECESVDDFLFITEDQAHFLDWHFSQRTFHDSIEELLEERRLAYAKAPQDEKAREYYAHALAMKEIIDYIKPRMDWHDYIVLFSLYSLPDVGLRSFFLGLLRKAHRYALDRNRLEAIFNRVMENET